MKYSRNIIAASRVFTSFIPTFPPCRVMPRRLEPVKHTTVRKHTANHAAFSRQPLPNLQFA
jgi:hypothetical protein